MVKLSHNEINAAIENESEIPSNEDLAALKDIKVGSDFRIPKGAYRNKNQEIISGEILKEAMSYSNEMLDLNELFEKGLACFNDTINLNNFPNIKVIQAAYQEQLEMLDENSKAQIESIHMSNNTPVGWDNNFAYTSQYDTQSYDEILDVRSYPNLKSLETHFYLNDSLVEIEAPEDLKTLTIQHSKVSQMDFRHFQDEHPDLECLLINRSKIKDVDVSEEDEVWRYDSLVGNEYVDDSNRYIYHEEQKRRDKEQQELNATFQNVPNENGTYNLLYKGKTVMTGLDKPAKFDVLLHFDISSVDYSCDFDDLYTINDKCCFFKNGEMFTKKNKVDGFASIYSFESTMNPNNRFYAYEAVSCRGEHGSDCINKKAGIVCRRMPYDSGRRSRNECFIFYQADDKGRVNPESVVMGSSFASFSSDLKGYTTAYDAYVENAKNKGISLSIKDRQQKEKVLIEAFINEKKSEKYPFMSFGLESYRVVEPYMSSKDKSSCLGYHIEVAANKIKQGDMSARLTIKKALFFAEKALKDKTMTIDDANEIPLVKDYSKYREALERKAAECKDVLEQRTNEESNGLKKASPQTEYEKTLKKKGSQTAALFREKLNAQKMGR